MMITPSFADTLAAVARNADQQFQRPAPIQEPTPELHFLATKPTAHNAYCTVLQYMQN
jgi:hypothetical protein